MEKEKKDYEDLELESKYRLETHGVGRKNGGKSVGRDNLLVAYCLLYKFQKWQK